MNKKVLSAAVIIAMLCFSLCASAQMRCPREVERLEQLQGCMVPIRGTIGVRYVGSALDMDTGYSRVALEANDQRVGVPPQVIPGGMGSSSAFSNIAMAGRAASGAIGPQWYMGWTPPLYMPPYYINY